MTMPLCPHCRRRKVCPGRRGLCWNCALDPAIREQYPASPQGPRPLSPAERRERVRAFRRRRAAGESYAAIAKDYGVSGEAVRLAVRGA